MPNILSGLLKTAGAGLQGYGADKQRIAAEALQRRAIERQEKDDRLKETIRLNTEQRRAALPTLFKSALGGDRGAQADLMAGGEASVKDFDAPPPKAPRLTVENGQLINLDEGTAKPVEGYQAPEPAKPNLSFQTIGGTDGQPPVVIGVDPKTGQKVSEVGPAKPTGATAKLTEAQEKSYLFYNLMKNAEPEITRALGSGRIRPTAVSAFLGANSLGDVPIVGKAIGAIAKPAANANLNEDEQQMIRAGKDFAAGVLRKESGAAVTNSELMEVMERYFPGMFGDKPGLTDAKNRARLQYMQTMEHEASPALQFYGRQRAGSPPPSRGGHETLSDEEFAKQWAAGKRSWP